MTVSTRVRSVLIAGACLLFATLPAAARQDAPGPRTVDWLNRVTFGVDATTLARYRQLGRERFLDEQLHPADDALPTAVQAEIDALEAERTPPRELARQLLETRQKIRALDKNDPRRRALAKALRKRGRQFADQAAQAEMLRAVYSPAQLREQMVWFWLNHFSVFQHKRLVGLFVADYTDRVIRPHALGSFRDLVMATLTSPAMLDYLDNDRNVRGRENENYARELMELHTLGVDAGYTQQDVQALMHILSGLGLYARGAAPRFGRRFGGPVVLNDLVAFYPGRHVAGDQVYLGHTLRSGGMDQIRRAVDLIVAQPACAKFISGELARYFVSDHPPPALVERMSATFMRTHGDIAAVLKTLFDAPEFTASLGTRFKDPMHFVVSAVRLDRDDRTITNAEPMVLALGAMGEPLFGRQTPDGWPLDAASWSSSGQLSDRFRIARALASGRALLYETAGTRKPSKQGRPADIESSALFQDALQPYLRTATRDALAKTRNRFEWNTMFLSSPDFNTD